MKKILWLTSWYPNKLQPFNGDFIQRHACAASLYKPVHVIYVIKDENEQQTSDVTVERNTSGNLSEVIAYYKPFSIGIKPLDKLFSLAKYIRIYRQLIRAFIAEHGLPAVVHVHVAMWAGVLANWIKKKYDINYLVTEHWSGYNAISHDNFYKKDFIFKRHAIRVLKNAMMLLPVSRQLGQLISTSIIPVTFEVVSNVVDTGCFSYSSTAITNRFRFVHVSTMDCNKNPLKILQVFSSLLAYKPNCELVMVGPASNELKHNAEKLGLNDFVQWKGEVQHHEVAVEMQHSSAMVMFSRYENQPCVILEALCCGLPVIATAVGGIPEIVDPSNGILIAPGDEHALLNAIIQMMDRYQDYNRFEISIKATALYNYKTIGKKMADLYDAV